MTKEQLTDEILNMPLMLVETAYLYAKYYTLYGVDVTKEWRSGVKNARALEMAYRDGYSDAMRDARIEKEKGEIICQQNTTL